MAQYITLYEFPTPVPTSEHFTETSIDEIYQTPDH